METILDIIARFVGLVVRIMLPPWPLPKGIYILIPGTCEYVTSHSKRELRVQIELRLLIGWS